MSLELTPPSSSRTSLGRLSTTPEVDAELARARALALRVRLATGSILTSISADDDNTSDIQAPKTSAIGVRSL